jgi:prepilin-type N-terminal cleavage/methylation domain-containing protein
MKKRGFTLIELMVAVVVLAVLVAIAIPQYIPLQKLARESEVKTAAHALQMAVEDYKTAPTWMGLKPSTAGELSIVLTSFLPVNIGMKRNPFNSAEYYCNGGIVFGVPAAVGRIGYQFSAQVMPYNISANGGDTGIIILTLVEGQ